MTYTFKFDNAAFVSFIKNQIPYKRWDYSSSSSCPIAQYLLHEAKDFDDVGVGPVTVDFYRNNVCIGSTDLPEGWDVLVRSVHIEARSNNKRNPTWAELYERAWTTLTPKGNRT